VPHDHVGGQSRRGAMMATLRCDHPDIEAFIDREADPARLRMFNLSVLVTDAFMAAVKPTAPWDLVFEGGSIAPCGARSVEPDHARDLRLRRTRRDLHRPDQRDEQPPNYCETIAATNPCGEQPLPPYGACLLGSVNLARLVNDPFGAEARAGPGRRWTIWCAVAVRMMDNVVDASRFPCPSRPRRRGPSAGSGWA
jgi:ribonucleoside-diphosphate reductase alpha chain